MPASCILDDRRRWLTTWGVGLAFGGGLLGCATAPPAGEDWHDVRLPGKSPTRYRWQNKGGRLAVLAEADGSASMWRRRKARVVTPDTVASFSWWVDELIAEANVRDADREDAPAKVLFGFGGDMRRLPGRTRAMFELAETLTGQRPPFATLMYVWDPRLPVDEMVVNPRTDRIRKIVLDSGPAGLGRWRDHQRRLHDDFLRAYGEPPGPLESVAVMTDADNTRSRARAWFGPVTVSGLAPSA